VEECDSDRTRWAASATKWDLRFVGERHGTGEFPRLLSDLASNVARHGPVVVAVELADDAQSANVEYLTSEGSIEDRMRLLSTPSWQRSDGRASLAMLALMDDLRHLVRGGADVGIDVFDVEPQGDPQSVRYQLTRERLLADRLLDIRRRGTTLVLTGNVHAELSARADAPRGFVPAAALIATEVSLVSIVGRRSGGESWCTLPVDGRLVTAAHGVDGTNLGDEPYIDLEPSTHGYRGVAYVGRITPSPPASKLDRPPT